MLIITFNIYCKRIIRKRGILHIYDVFITRFSHNIRKCCGFSQRMDKSTMISYSFLCCARAAHSLAYYAPHLTVILTCHIFSVSLPTQMLARIQIIHIIFAFSDGHKMYHHSIFERTNTSEATQSCLTNCKH